MKIEVGKTYQIDGYRSNGKVYLIDEVRADGTICGRRWIKTTQKFSGQSYILWHNWNKIADKAPLAGVPVADPRS